jgi:AraC family transcriptional regulator
MPLDVGFDFEAREVGSGRWQHHEVRPGELCVLGAGAAPSELSWRAMGHARNFDVVELYIEPTALQSSAQEDTMRRNATQDRAEPAAWSLEPQWRVLRDPLLTELLRGLAADLDGPCAAEDAFGDLALTLFGVQLGRIHGVPAGVPKLRRAGLAPFVLERVREYVAAHLSKPIRLQQLARVAGLSPFHFSRAFKVSTGLSPHAYVTHCRIAESKRLLSRSNLSIAEIARRTGFGCTGQLSTRFRACTGATPSGYRRLGKP